MPEFHLFRSGSALTMTKAIFFQTLVKPNSFGLYRYHSVASSQFHIHHPFNSNNTFTTMLSTNMAIFGPRPPPALVQKRPLSSTFQTRQVNDEQDVKKKETLDKKLVEIPIHFRSKEKNIKEAVKDIYIDAAAKEKGEFGPHVEYQPYTLPHPIWSKEELEAVKVSHRKPEKFIDYLAYTGVMMLRFNFDVISGFLFGKRNEKKWLNRIVFLETVAGVPGMVAAMVRHLNSLRRMKRDHGWIHTLLEEAENERMHLMTALHLKQPTFLFKAGVVIAQGFYVGIFSILYMVSPQLCHRLVGYLEEEAVKTYTKCIEDLDSGKLPVWSKTPAPLMAKEYWNLPEDAMMRDVILAIRADEAHHRFVNHTLSSMKPNEDNPFMPGK